MSAALKSTLIALDALDRGPQWKRDADGAVDWQRDPADFCAECGAESVFGDFDTDYRNGHEISLCSRCK